MMLMEVSSGSRAAAQDREGLAMRHVGLVHHIARRMARTIAPGVELGDLVSGGMIGLLQAIDSFKPEYNLAFSTYAAPRIRGAILDDLRRNDHVSRTTRRREREVQRMETKLASRLSRVPRHTEVARELGVDTETLWGWKSNGAEAVHVSLEHTDASDLLPGLCADDLDAPIEREQQRRWLAAQLANLSEREREVVGLYYTQELTLRQIAEVLGVTESRISQIRTAALGRLRKQWETRSEC